MREESIYPNANVIAMAQEYIDPPVLLVQEYYR